MTGKLTRDETDPLSDIADDSDKFEGRLKSIGGSDSDHWNIMLVGQTNRSLWLDHSDPLANNRECTATAAALMGIGPKDELEGMMAAQLIAAHNATMGCYRRAMMVGQSVEGHRLYLGQANKLSRTYATLLDALNRHRGKGQQKVTVEHVHVHAGGQAVVGVVDATGAGPGGGDDEKQEDQPHAKQLTHAHQPALRSPDEGRHAVSIARDEERSLPDARRRVARRGEGQ